MMLDYQPANFYTQVFSRYPETWEILSSPEACLLMRDMTKIGLPAVDTLHYLPSLCQLVIIVDSESPEMSETFRNMVGYMCGQVMEHLGYEVEKADESTVFSRFFQYGSVYRLRTENA